MKRRFNLARQTSRNVVRRSSSKARKQQPSHARSPIAIITTITAISPAANGTHQRRIRTPRGAGRPRRTRGTHRSEEAHETEPPIGSANASLVDLHEGLQVFIEKREASAVCAKSSRRGGNEAREDNWRDASGNRTRQRLAGCAGEGQVQKVVETRDHRPVGNAQGFEH